jgi:transcriptional regulator with XRE-family HTH domain
VPHVVCHTCHMTDTPMTLADLIRSRREARNLSRDSLAHTVGSSLSTITRIELNDLVASAETLFDLEDELELAPGELKAAVRATTARRAEPANA